MSGKMMREIGFAGVLLAMVLVGCGSTAAAPSAGMVSDTVPPPIDEQATRRAEAVATLGAVSTGTAVVPTSTPYVLTCSTMPSQMPVTAPGEFLSEDGPWLVFLGALEEYCPAYLWALNADGTGLTRLAQERVEFFRAVANEQGVYVAYVTSRDGWLDLVLRILRLPDMNVVATIPLATAETAIDGAQADGQDAVDTYEIARAITETSPEWSPDGQHLAFIGAMNGPSADVYTYSLNTGMITRLTSGPNQPYRLVWSPDGRYVVHASAYEFGTGAGHNVEGIWAARADGLGVRLLDTPTVYGNRSGGEIFWGWLSTYTVITSDWNAGSGNVNLRAINIVSGESHSYWEGCFWDAAFDPVTRTLALTFYDASYSAQCSPDAKPGIFLIQPEAGLHRVSDVAGDYIQWSSEANIFWVRVDRGPWRTVSPDGRVISLEPLPFNQLLVNPARDLWALTVPGDAGYKGVWVAPPFEPGVQIFSGHTWDATWSPDGVALFIFSEDQLLLASDPDYTPVVIASGLYAPPLLWATPSVWLP